jgi:hypothetical protein
VAVRGLDHAKSDSECRDVSVWRQTGPSGRFFPRLYENAEFLSLAPDVIPGTGHSVTAPGTGSASAGVDPFLPFATGRFKTPKIASSAEFVPTKTQEENSGFFVPTGYENTLMLKGHNRKIGTNRINDRGNPTRPTNRKWKPNCPFAQLLRK